MTETEVVPTWLKELEEKREKRLKSRLGHETGAGSPCLTCQDKCPGLDLHFWRKICKNCKCGKESHDCHDDDIYGWAQMQLLGSKPEKPRKIVLPGQKEAVELEWMPKGQSELVDSYLKDIPSHLLPIKGSAAAQERKQLLQKQIPLHDIDPSLCHALSETEIKKMSDYISHIKENSVGVGHIVKLKPLNRANMYHLPNISTELLSTQLSNSQQIYQKGAERAEVLKGLENLNLNERKILNPVEDFQNYTDNLSKIRTKRGEVKENESNPIQPYFDSSRNNYSLPHYSHQFPHASEVIQSPKKFNVTDIRPEHLNNDVSPHNQNHPYNSVEENTRLSNYPPKNHLNFLRSNLNPILENNDENYDYLRNYVPQELCDEQLQKLDNLRDKLPANYASMKYDTFLDNRDPTTVKNLQDVNYPQYANVQNQRNPANTPLIQEETPSDFVTSQTENFPPQLRHFTSPLPPKESTQRQDLQGHKTPTSNLIQNKQNLAEMNHVYPSGYNPLENLQNPTFPNIGSIYDIEFPVHETNPSEQGFCNDSGKNFELQNVPDINTTFPECHRCKKMFEDNANAIGIEKTDALWHSECFKCAGCNQKLADWWYFFDKESNDIYCGRDYAKIRGIPRCLACDELIFVKEYCLAENNTFHVKHFCCFQCDEPLAGKNYLMEDNQPLCLPCFEKLKAEHCNTCKEIIKPDQPGANLKGVHFHADDACFSCKVCLKPLLGSKFLFKNETLFCSAVCVAVLIK